MFDYKDYIQAITNRRTGLHHRLCVCIVARRDCKKIENDITKLKTGVLKSIRSESKFIPELFNDLIAQAYLRAVYCGKAP